MRLISCIAFLILISNATFAQIKNYQPAEIVLKNGETINGLINYMDWRVSPDKITYKKNETATSETLTVKEVAFFTVADQRYISQEIIYENSPIRNMAKVQASNDKDIVKSAIVEDGGGIVSLENSGLRIEPLFDTTHIFLETLIDGEKSLFLYRDKGARSHFFIKKKDDYELLFYCITRKKVDFNDIDIELTSSVTIKVNEDKKYHIQLLDYLKDCSGIQNMIVQTEYTLKDMQSIFEEYYECKGQQTAFKKQYQSKRTKINVLVGGSLNSVNSNITTYRHFVGGNYTYPSTLLGGVNFDFPILGNLNRHALVNELLYKEFKLSGDWSAQEGASITRERTFNLDVSFIRWNLMYRYRPLQFEKSSFFANAGFSNGLSFVRENSMTNTTRFGNVSTTETDLIALESVRRLHMGLVGGLGGTYGRFTGEIRYELGGDLTDLTNSQLYTKSLYLAAGFRLN